MAKAVYKKRGNAELLPEPVEGQHLILRFCFYGLLVLSFAP